MVQKTLNKQKMKTPNNWITCKLQEVCSTTSGGTPSRRHSEYYKGSIPWIKSGELNDSIILNSKEHISEDAIKNSNAKLFPVGSLLIALYGATIGKMAFLGVPATTNQAICCIFKNSGVNLNFLFYFLLLNRTNLINQGKGGAQKNISQNLLKDLIIPVPPMAEQKRIVKKIEELFGVIDEQVKRLEATHAALVSYRQSILQQAFSGKLHKTTDWKKITLQEAVDINPKTVLPALSDSEMVSFLPMPAVQEESLEYAEQKSAFGKVKKGYTKFRDEDVLFAKITPCMENGKGCIVHNLSHGIGFGSTEFHVLRCHKDVFPKFIYYFVIRRTFRAEAKNKMSGAVGQQRVPAEFLKEYSFACPSLPEQKAIVKKIENAFAFADKAQATITGALEQAKQLKQSILKQAFEGKLLLQDPNDKPVDLTQIKKDKHK